MMATPFPRARALLQSFDAAKYQDQARSSVYVAHARSEVLGAMLFGHEIVIPAGSVADSTAFTTLLSEVMDPAQQALKRLRTHGGYRYSPFRVGLEPRFSQAHRGLVGYDAFVDDYVRSFTSGRNDFSQLAALARERGLTDPGLVIPLLGRAYLEGRFKEIEAISPVYAHHSNHVFKLFSARAELSLDPVFARRNAFTYAPRDLYLKGLERFCDIVERRRIGYDGLQVLKPRFRQVFETIANPRRRGEWYNQRERFEEHWLIVRVWLDQVLYGRMIDNYEIAVPSLLQQPTPDDPVSRAAAVAFLDDDDYADALDWASLRHIVPLPIKRVPWQEVWDIVTAPEFQQSLNEMHGACHQAQLDARRRKDEIKGARATGAAEAKRRIRQDFREEVADAAKRHVSFLSAASTTFRFTRDSDGMLLAHTRRRQRLGMTPKKQEAAFKFLGAAADVGLSTVTGSPPLMATAAIALADHFLFGKRVEKGIRYVVKKVSVKPEDSNMVGLVERGQRLVNLWASPV